MLALAFAGCSRARRIAALVLALCCGATACLTPPALYPAGPVDLASCVQSAHGEKVELASGDSVLRGVFVPAGADAPVVLHLLGSAQSVGSLPASMHFLFERLSHVGFASLALDYGGVGASGGVRDVRNLREDALAMWQEALRRAGGDPQRVILRCTSIGGIAASELLDAGARPRAVIWIAPVSPRTAVHQAIARTAGTFAATLLSWMFAPISSVDPAAVLRSSCSPLLLVCSDRDSFVDAPYLQSMKKLASAAGCECIDQRESEHEWLAASSLEPSAREALWLLEHGAPSAAPREPQDELARAAWLADAGLRERFRTLSRLAPDLSADEVVAAAELEDSELAAFLVWLRGIRKTPSAPFLELAQSYRALEEHRVDELLALQIFHVINGNCPIGDLQVAAPLVRTWDGTSPVTTRWHRGLAVISQTFTLSPEVGAKLGIPADLESRRAWLLEIFARSMGLLVSRHVASDGVTELRYLDDAGQWIVISRGGPAEALAR